MGAVARRTRPARRAFEANDHACSVERALTVVGAKWTLLILHNLMGGPRRFGELQREIDGASPKMLTARLRELERLGLVARTAYLEVPPRVEYALTRVGRSVWPIVDALDHWGRTLKSS